MAEPVEELFARYPEDVQAISRKLRAMVKAAMPGANEVLYASQNHIGYLFAQTSATMITYITPMQSYVRLGFMYGVNLPDPKQMLVGEGKRLRHVKVRTLAEADNPALEQLVKDSWMDAVKHMKKPK